MASGKVDPQMEFEEIPFENVDLLAALEAREECKGAVGTHRKASAKIKDMVAEFPPKLIGKRVRVGRFTFNVVNDPGGDEREGYQTKPGIKPKKIRADKED